MYPREFQMPVRKFFRKRRFKNFLLTFASCRTILDIGGEHYTWEIIGRRDGVVLLNMSVPEDTDAFPYILGSGLLLPFADKSVDLAFSNSVIEHVGTEENQFQFAREMLRVGKKIYCQTPCRLFPIDPHSTTPFVHWLPRKWLRPVFLRYFTLNGWLFRKPYEYDVTWLSKKRLLQMFPGCKITTERFLGVPKSFTVSN
jgi:ubiquinone/menaquinone biosynthesis C-methylase UbiE